MRDTQSHSDLVILRRLLFLARPYWPFIISIFFIELLSIPLALLSPLTMKIAIDSVLGSEPLPGPLEALLPSATRNSGQVLILVAGLVILLALLSHLQGLGCWLLRTFAGEKLVLAFRTRLFQHAQRLSFSYHDSKGTIDSIYRIQYDAPSIQWILIDGFIPFITLIFTLAGMIYVTVRINWQLALIALSVSPIIFLATEIYRPRLRKQWTEVKNLESSALSVVQEVLAALRVVKAFGQEERERDRFVRHFSNSVRSHIRVIFAESGFNLLIGLATAVGTAAVLFIGVRQVQTSTLTLGELLIVMSYLAQLYGPLGSIGQRVAVLQGSLASAERAFALLDNTPEVEDRPDALSLTQAVGSIEFRQVSFAYNDNDQILNNVSFRIDAGTRVGIVGRTGAGKTTLVSLLNRFYDPCSGQILLDGVDIRNYKLDDLRKQFAIVLQEPVLFSTTILENIAYARPDAQEEEIVEAAKASNAHDFITKLPDGYNTVVGERGMRLSGGERQRIALARAFLKNSPILILDEPTSSVDVETESVIMEAMERLMKDRTTFMIAHRLGTLKNCDGLLTINEERYINIKWDVLNAINDPLIFSGQAEAASLHTPALNNKS